MRDCEPAQVAARHRGRAGRHQMEIIVTKEEHQKSLADFAAYAERHIGGDISRAAESGYDVSSFVVAHVIDSMLPSGDRCWYAVGSHRAATTWLTEREAPHAAAMDLEARLRDEICTITKPECVTVSVDRIVRVEDRRNGPVEKWTAVLVLVKSPLTGDRIVLYRAEKR